MPELPEVETTRRGIEPYLKGRRVTGAIIRHPQLRWPVAKEISTILPGQIIKTVTRRGKYLLLQTQPDKQADKQSDKQACTVILHLGMSGSLRVVSADTPVAKHDHLDVLLESGQCLRYTDPRRFGAALWTSGDPLQHALLINLGPEPLSDDFNAAYLFVHSRKKRIAVKQYIMNSKVVVGVGNIYASEALFLAGIRPGRAAGRLTCTDCEKLAAAIKQVLQAAIRQGGTTLRDYTNPDGKAGYFSVHLKVYGRADEPCRVCGTLIKSRVQGQRATYYCNNCQV